MSDHTLQNPANPSELEARGLRPVVLWVPDTRRPGCVDEFRRQLSLVESEPDDRQTLDFIEAAAWSDLRRRSDALVSVTEGPDSRHRGVACLDAIHVAR